MNWNGEDVFNKRPLANITLNGVPMASIVNLDNFSFAYVGPYLCSIDINRIISVLSEESMVQVMQ